MLRQYLTCFPEGKRKALTFSYDDGRIADKQLVDIFNRYGLRATFHLNGQLLYSENKPQNPIWRTSIFPDEVKELFCGHEIAAHTATHPMIDRTPLEMTAQEIIEDRKILEQLVQIPVRGLSYPFGVYNNQIKDLLPALGIDYSRIVGDSESFNLPTDWFTWKPTCHHNHKLLELGEKFKAIKNSLHLHLMYVWGHSYEFACDNNWDLIEDFAKQISSEDDIWYATNYEIYAYMEASKRLQYAASGDFVYNPSAIDIWIEVDAKVFRVPAALQVGLN